MEMQDMPCLAMGESDQDRIISSWLGDSDVSELLDMTDAPILDFENVTSKSAEYFCFDSQYSPETPPSFASSPYSSPELPEMEGSFTSVDTPLFDSQIDVDSVLFSGSFNPEVLPELERILSSVECISSPDISAPQSPASGNEEPEKPSKKRKGDDGKEIKGSNILLPRDQLLVMTSAEIESYVSTLKSQRNLSAAEEKELKRQRRLVKNREYASQSRSRKKQFVDELEQTIATLREENNALKQQVGTLSEENKTMKKRMSAIATTIKKSSTSLSNSSSGVLTRLTTVGRPSNAKTVGTCLLAIMFMVFSVGMIGDNRSKFEIYTVGQDTPWTSRAILEIPEPVMSEVIPANWKMPSIRNRGPPPPPPPKNASTTCPAPSQIGRFEVCAAEVSSAKLVFRSEPFILKANTTSDRYLQNVPSSLGVAAILSC